MTTIVNISKKNKIKKNIAFDFNEDDADIDECKQHKNCNTTDFCDCNFNSNFAYLSDMNKIKIQDEPISITNFLKDKKIQTKVKKGVYILLCENNNELIKHKSEKKKSYFYHKNIDFENEMTKWHREWQENFDENEVHIGTRWADAKVGNNILEFQYSYILEDTVYERSKNYTDKNYNIIWIIECNKCVNIEKIDDKYIITFINELWKYENFKRLKNIYLEYENNIYKISPSEVKSNVIIVQENINKKDFIESIKKNINILETEHDKPIIYYNQRGAGCGKTFESIQLLDKDERFLYKNTFIYLTKMNSAINPIKNEFKKQKDKYIDNLTFDETDDDANNDCKQHKISYINKITGQQCKVIIGTIDSFIYAISNKLHNGRDFFSGLLKSIIEGEDQIKTNGNIEYTREKINDTSYRSKYPKTKKSVVKINKQCLIIVDEAQDLGDMYIKCLDTIIQKTGVDLYIIGDKLQSLWYEHNVFTYLEMNKLNESTITTIEKHIGDNIVRRFHNSLFPDIINKVIKFKKYGLPEICGICNKTVNCEYHISHKNIEKQTNAFEIFELPEIYSNDYDVDKVNRVIEDITKKMDNEINNRILINEQIKQENIKNNTNYPIINYTPNNFLFIFPYMKKNYLAQTLEMRLQEYWIRKFSDKYYIDNVLKNDNFWKDNLNDDIYNKYVYLHKSDDGRSINLDESENATRLLSIHASKGNGCEIVFLLGVSEKILMLYSKEKDNLMYESLLHVALTRQKEKLYIGIVYNNDDIHNRLKQFDPPKNQEILPSINISKYHNYEKIINELSENDDFYSHIKNIIDENTEYKYIMTNFSKKENNVVIDFGHHIIRRCIMEYFWMLNVIQHPKTNLSENDANQFLTIITKLSKLEIIKYEYSNYRDILHDINKKKKEANETFSIYTLKFFPLLIFKSNDNVTYAKYGDIIFDIIKHIQTKIKKSVANKKIPVLCPIESVILMHMRDIYDNLQYAEITVMNVYSIIYNYDNCSSSITEDHSINNNCICNKKFTSHNYDRNEIYFKDIRKSITLHYNNIILISEMFENHIKKISNTLNDSSEYKYNVWKKINYYKDNNLINIFDIYTLIAYNDFNVIHYIFSPQLNILNINKIMISTLLHNYIMKNIYPNDYENYTKYNSKNIYACVVSFDFPETILINLNIDRDNDIIKNYIQSYIFNKYEYINKSAYQLYNYYKINRDGKKNSIEKMCEVLNKKENERCPDYIKSFFKDLRKKIDYVKKEGKDSIMEIIKVCENENNFLTELNERLLYEIKLLFNNINQTKDNDSDDINDF